ncbi:MAG: electron transfer flavoprotein subunit beta/FixA family protein [Thermicanus sp.]|nr:electron transfer flavoprotein subunit beta/FixA family protein [Thermicanus sp.]
MKMLVLLKQTFDTEEKVVIAGGEIQEENVEWIINPYDEYAVEEAIRLKEAHGGEVVLLSAGPDRVESALRKALAMGADRAILIHDLDRKADESLIAQALGEVVKRENPDLLLAGNLSVDNGAGQVAVRVAELVGYPHIAAVTKVEVEGNLLRAVRDVEGDEERVEGTLPLLITAQQGLNEPRYTSLPGIMKAKKKPLERISIQELGLSSSTSLTEVVEVALPPKRDAGKILTGDLAEQVKELVHLLHTEAKVI